MKPIRSYISLLLLAAFSVLAGPKEIVHELLSHHDTEDVHCTDSCRDHFSEQHRHCDVLQLSSPPLCLSVNNFSFSFETVASSVASLPALGYHFSSSPFLFFRGPPAIV
jgi:hypothetical protein